MDGRAIEISTKEEGDWRKRGAETFQVYRSQSDTASRLPFELYLYCARAEAPVRSDRSFLLNKESEIGAALRFLSMVPIYWPTRYRNIPN